MKTLKMNDWIFFSYIMIFFMIYSINCEVPADPKPEYMQVFSEHQHWEGRYVYNGTQNYCMLFVHSEHHLKKNGLLTTFKDRLGATIEMEGEQVGSEELEVIFTVHVMFNHVNRFPTNFTFHSTLYQQQNLWYLRANVTVPHNGLFGDILLHQTDSTAGPWFDDGTHAWQYFIIIGIPVIAVIGISSIVAMVYWGLKKGYIRRIPKSYDNFENPVHYETNRENVHTSIAENVHI